MDSDIAQSKAFLRTFVKKMVIEGTKACVEYTLPVPVSHNESRTGEVLPMVSSGGAEGIRTPYLFNAIEALSQLSYSPMR